MTTVTRTAVPNGAEEIQRKAASNADAMQCGVNIVASAGSFRRHLLALQKSGVRGEELFNHRRSQLHQQAQLSLLDDH